MRGLFKAIKSTLWATNMTWELWINIACFRRGTWHWQGRGMFCTSRKIATLDNHSRLIGRITREWSRKNSWLRALGTKLAKEGSGNWDNMGVEKILKPDPSPQRNQWTLSVSSTDLPIALSWSHNDRKERAYSAKPNNVFFLFLYLKIC